MSFSEWRDEVLCREYQRVEPKAKQQAPRRYWQSHEPDETDYVLDETNYLQQRNSFLAIEVLQQRCTIADLRASRRRWLIAAVLFCIACWSAAGYALWRLAW
jgi:hypothetical protein